MKKSLQEAIDSADKARIRSLLTDMAADTRGNAAVVDDITAAVASVPGLFEPDDGKFYAVSAEMMTAPLIDSLRQDLDSNFSLPKFRLFVETQAILHRDPKFYSHLMQESDATGLITESAEAATAGAGVFSKIAFAIMAVGVAVAVVGNCVSLKFLLGVGIGVIMLGSALAYRAIVSRDRRMQAAAGA